MKLKQTSQSATKQKNLLQTCVSVWCRHPIRSFNFVTVTVISVNIHFESFCRNNSQVSVSSQFALKTERPTPANLQKQSPRLFRKLAEIKSPGDELNGSLVNYCMSLYEFTVKQKDQFQQVYTKQSPYCFVNLLKSDHPDVNSKE